MVPYLVSMYWDCLHACTLLVTAVLRTIFAVGVFLVFGLWHMLAGLFVYFLLPETRGIPLEQVTQLLCIQYGL